jgi:ribosome-binding factor A
MAGRRPQAAAGRHYPRTARVNEVLREVLADAIERLADTDDRLLLLTVTGVQADPDLRHAVVLFASLSDDAKVGLEAVRARLQATIAHQVRLRRTPQLSFAPDPAVATGEQVERILRDLGGTGAAADEDGGRDGG